MTPNEKCALHLATLVFDSLIDAHYGLDKVDTVALSTAAGEYLKHAAAVIKPPLCNLARETALFAHDWIADPTPERWEQLREAAARWKQNDSHTSGDLYQQKSHQSG